LGGFLGSGKTTVLLSLAKYITDRFQRADSDRPALAIIENEIGDIGVDNLTLESANYKVTSLFSGCICCALTSDLTRCVNEIVEKYKPPYIAIEATGLAYPDSIADTIKKYSPECERILTIVIVDARRWDEHMETLDLMISRQIRDADILLLNKTDRVNTETKTRIIAELSSLNPTARIFAISARRDSLIGIWKSIVPDMRKNDNGGSTPT
jgi:G3E family GTPase